MEAVYKAYDINASEKLNLKEYFDEYSNQANLGDLDTLKSSLSEKDAFLRIMQEDLSDDDFATISEYCRQAAYRQDKFHLEGGRTVPYRVHMFPDKVEEQEKLDRSVEKLTVAGEVPMCSEACFMKRKEVYEKTEMPTEDTNLETLSELKKRQKTDQKTFISQLKHRSEIFIRPDETIVEGPTLQPGEEMLVYIRFYAPFTYHRRCDNATAMQKISMMNVFAMLGSQTLDQLRDMISCPSDLTLSTDISDDPARALGQCAKDIYKSGFFYIEGTFYNDFRDPNNLDYSAVIREWASGRNLGPFQTSTMQGIRIDSLSVRFGYPWVYLHQGTCEHLFVFSDARLLNSTDVLTVPSYPRIEKVKARRTRYCMMCGTFAARWITTDNDRLPHDPCYFCDTCFHSYNYVDEAKVGHFKAYPFPSNTDVTLD